MSEVQLSEALLAKLAGMAGAQRSPRPAGGRTSAAFGVERAHLARQCAGRPGHLSRRFAYPQRVGCRQSLRLPRRPPARVDLRSFRRGRPAFPQRSGAFASSRARARPDSPALPRPWPERGRRAVRPARFQTASGRRLGRLARQAGMFLRRQIRRRAAAGDARRRG